jgi:hypothetical protein
MQLSGVVFLQIVAYTQAAYNSCHFDFKHMQEFFDAKLNICITLPDMLVQGLTEVVGFIIWLCIGH